MPIKFACSCGTQLRVADKDAGRRVKCPKCGDTVTSPSEPPRSSDPDDDDRPSRRKRDDDGIQESPRRRSAAVDDDDERPSRRDEDDREENEDEEDRPKRKKRPRKAEKKAVWPLVLAVVLGVILVLGGGGFAVAWFFFLRTPNVNDMAYVPPDAQGFVTFRVADVWKQNAWQKMLTATRRMGGAQDPFSEVQQLSGIIATDVERITVVFQDLDQAKPTVWFVVRTLKPYDRKTILSKLTSAKEVKHEGKSYHLGQISRGPSGPPPIPGMKGGPPGLPGGPGGGAPAGEETAIYPAGSHVLVYSNEEGIKKCMTAAARKSATGPLAAAIQKAEAKDQFLGAFNLPPAAQTKLKSLPGMFAAMMPKMPSNFQAMLDITGGTFVSNFKGDILDTEIALTYPDADKASKAKKGFDALRALAEIGLGTAEEQLKQAMPPEQAAKITKFLKDLLDGIGAEVSGNEMKISNKIDTKAIENLMPDMGGPGGGMPPGGFRPGMPPGKQGPKR
jgi:hypothetical protein